MWEIEEISAPSDTKIKNQYKYSNRKKIWRHMRGLLHQDNINKTAHTWLALQDILGTGPGNTT